MTQLEDLVQAAMAAPPGLREAALRLLQENLPKPDELGRIGGVFNLAHNHGPIILIAAEHGLGPISWAEVFAMKSSTTELFEHAKTNLPDPERLRAAAILFLTDGAEWEAATILSSCTLEYGQVRCQRGTVYEIDITLRCGRSTVQSLSPKIGSDGSEEDPELKLIISEAIKASLPSGYGICNCDARFSLEAKPDDNTKFRDAVFATIAEQSSLMAMGRSALDILVNHITPALSELGIKLPDRTLPDDKYAAEVSAMLKSLEGKSDKLQAYIGDVFVKLTQDAIQAQRHFEERHLPVLLTRCRAGRPLLRAVAEGDAMQQDYPDTLTKEQSDLVGMIMSYVRDFADIADDVDPEGLLNCERSMSEQLESLERQGLSLFAGCYASRRTFEEGKTVCLRVSVLLLTRCDDSRIKKQADGTEYIRAAIPRKPSGEKKPGESRARNGDGNTPKEPSTTPVQQFTFRQAGAVCDIVFDGSAMFHLNITDGVKYLDYLLHHANEPIRAFDLELTVKPEKAAVRTENSKQKTLDAQAKRQALMELVNLKDELEEAKVAGNNSKADRLKSEIDEVEAVLANDSLLSADTGERARDNVRKAIDKVLKKLRKGGKAEQAFGRHLDQFISRGYEVIYNQPKTIKWG